MNVRYDAARPAAAPVVAAPANRRRIRPMTVLKLAVTIGLSAFVLYRFGLGDAVETLVAAKWRFVALAACFAVLAMTLNVKRWQLMLEGQQGSASLPTLIRLYLVGMFFNNVLPSRLGGDVVRAYGASIVATTRTRSVAAVLMDRLVGAVSVLILGVIAILAAPSVMPGQLGEVLILGLMASGIALGLLLVRSSRLGVLREVVVGLVNITVFGVRIGSKVEAAIDAVRSYSRFRGLIARALAISMLANGLSIVNLYLYALAVGAEVSLAEMAVVAPAVLAIGLLPLSINGIGTIELTFVVLLGAMGVDSPVALAVALLRRLVLLGQSLVGGLLYSIRKFA